MKAGAALTKEKTLDLYARINELSTAVVLKFSLNGGPYDITDLDFEVPVYRAPNAKNPLFTLTIGDGLTVQGTDADRLAIVISAARAADRQAESNFWRLFSRAELHTWLNGAFRWHNGDFNGVQDLHSSTLITDEMVTIEVMQGLDTSGSMHLIEDGYDASTNLFPDAPLGSGVSGALARGDMFFVTTAGTLLDRSEAVQYVPAGSILMLTGNPLAPQLGANWRILS